jgi:hypothetical protein
MNFERKLLLKLRLYFKYTLVAFQGHTGGVEIPLTVKANQRLEIEAELKK